MNDLEAMRYGFASTINILRTNAERLRAQLEAGSQRPEVLELALAEIELALDNLELREVDEAQPDSGN